MISKWKYWKGEKSQKNNNAYRALGYWMSSIVLYKISWLNIDDNEISIDVSDCSDAARTLNWFKMIIIQLL